MIVVTAPTSTIGRQVVRTLLSGGEAIRLIARDPGRLTPDIAQRVEIVAGSHADAAIVDRAFAGADAVFWLVPADPRSNTVAAAYQEFARPACAAFRRHGIKHVVGVSALGRGWQGEAGHVTATLAMDDMIAATGVAYRALTMPSFMDNILRQAEAIREQGVFFWPVDGDLKLPTCATKDIAAVAARLLLDRSWSGQGSVPVLGPEDLSFNEMAAILSDVLGKSVRFQEVPAESLRPRLTGNGYSPAMAQAMIDMLVAKSHGLDTLHPRTAEGTTPTSFRHWCEEVLKPVVSG